jgi:hypothetical protein
LLFFEFVEIAGKRLAGMAAIWPKAGYKKLI